MTSPRTLESLLRARVLVLDGAMGTQLQRLRLVDADFRGERFRRHSRDLFGDYDALTLTRPDLVSRVHAEYLESGSDIIRTNTFSSTAVAQADFGLSSSAYEFNLTAARLARAACDVWRARTPHQPRFVAGTIGPTNRSVSILPSRAAAGIRAVAFGQLRDAYKEQVRGLIEGGCDLLLVETVFDLANAQAALAAIAEVCIARPCRLPVMLSATVSDSGRMLTGQTIEAFWAAVAQAKPLIVGLNCSPAVHTVRPHLEELARHADCYVSCHPSAGLPDLRGEYAARPADFADALRDLASRGVANIVGGCCGTTPAHITAVVEAVRDMPPRSAPAPIPHGRS
ncbi:MAG: homocysteine S-methyltransferase family protein [Acidobacteriota bacterium]